MKTIASLLIPFVVASLAATSAVAGVSGEATPDYPMSFTSSVKSADLAAQARMARNMGTIADGEIGSQVAEASTMPASRAQVRAELDVARSLGLTAVGEQSVEPTVAQVQAIHQAGQRVVALQVASR